MIKLIGVKRVMFLACLLMLNLSVAAGYFLYLSPMGDDAQAQLDAVNGQIAGLRGKIANIKQDMAMVQENLPKYNDLKNKGFFLNQDRFMISRTMEDLRQKAGIASFAFSVADVAEIPNADASSIGYKLINSRIKVDKIISPLDANIYVLVQEMSNVFPDYARIQSMDIKRTGEVTVGTLKDIAAGKPVDFVNAELEFDWITMVPKPDETTTGAGGTPAGLKVQ